MKKAYLIIGILLLVFAGVYLYRLKNNNGNCSITLFNETGVDSVKVIIKLDHFIDSTVLRNQYWENFYKLSSINLPLGKNDIQFLFPKYHKTISKSVFIWNCHFIYVDIYGINDSIDYDFKSQITRRGFE